MIIEPLLLFLQPIIGEHSKVEVKHMNDDCFRWVELCAVSDAIEAHLLKGLLAQANIDVRLQGEHLSGAVGELPCDQVAVQLLVYAIKLPEAQEILVNYNQSKRQSDSATADWVCRQCEELNGPAFEYCWQCGNKHE
ncbi:putative signal transducing protein [Pseudoalteromonas sp. UG3-2]|uniref:putative signal transducing protein n=1 Tax=Pseudoalteromonas sp. UG3-2 TaxID=3079885 RepID=UPI0030149166